MSELNFSVPSMSCGNCVRHVHEALAEVNGVTTVDVDLESKKVVVMGEPLDREALFAAVREAGYEPVG